VWVSYDSGNAALSLNSVTKKVTWNADAETEGKSLRSVCEDMMN